jgi:hypothetical protein
VGYSRVEHEYVYIVVDEKDCPDVEKSTSMCHPMVSVMVFGIVDLPSSRSYGFVM